LRYIAAESGVVRFKELEKEISQTFLLNQEIRDVKDLNQATSNEKELYDKCLEDVKKIIIEIQKIRYKPI
jgi:hypothetical protein